MMTDINSVFHKWLKNSIKEKFGQEIGHKLNRDIDVHSIVKKITSTKNLKVLIRRAKRMKVNSNDTNNKVGDNVNNTDKLGSLLSLDNDLPANEWSPVKPHGDDLPVIVDSLSIDKPVHVRLASFEALMDSDLINNCSDDFFSNLITFLKDGIADSSRPIFQSSLRVYSKLLDSSRSHDAYITLINIFENEYYSKKFSETLPNFNIGISFKIFLHEKLFRILYLIIKHHEQSLKTMRTVDRKIEEIIDTFITFLTSQNVSSALAKTLSIFNLVSILEPQAHWLRRWIHNFSVRKIFITALGKSPNLLEIILKIVEKGLEVTPGNLTYCVIDDTSNFFVSSETIVAMTYFHSLNILSQLYSYISGRNLIRDTQIEVLSSDDFLITMINCLNSFACSATVSRIVYTEARQALKLMLEKPTFNCDTRFYHAALNHLLKSNNNSGSEIWPHTIDILIFMLTSSEGLNFLTTDYRCNSATSEESTFDCLITIVLINIAELLRQPFAVMDTQRLVQSFIFIEKYFQIMTNFDIVKDALKDHLLPALEFFYHKLDKYSIGYENWTQCSDNSIKNMLLKLSTSPLGLQLLSKYSSVFEELIQGSINPLRYSWNSNEIVTFISTAAFFYRGQQIIAALIPQTFSLLLTDVCSNSENPSIFFDSWSTINTTKFIHIIAVLSLNTECFNILMKDTVDGTDDESIYLRNFCDLLNSIMIGVSPYHEFSLLILENMIWNLDIFVNLLHIYNFETELWQLQEENNLDVRQCTEKFNDVQSEVCVEIEEHNVMEDQNDNNGEITVEVQKIYAIDNLSIIWDRILKNSYYIQYKLNKIVDEPETLKVLHSFSPLESERTKNKSLFESESISELDEFLNECRPGLRDSGWINQLRKAHRNSQFSMGHSTIINLLDKMEEAIPTVEWVDMFQWENKLTVEYFWLPEEEVGLKIAIRFAKQNCDQLENPIKAKENLKLFYEAAHTYIKYEKMHKFKGFDWFLSTVFIFCNGNFDKCQYFISQIVRFPSAIYMWRILGSVVDQANEEEVAVQLTLAQHLDSIINAELPAINYALKNEFGIQWWIICDRLLTQCFWGVLEWTEIMHFFTVCILNPPDYIVYYCVSLLAHCEPSLMQDITDEKYWPEHLDLSQYRCYNYLGFMDRLAKKYRNNVLSSLTQIKLIKNSDYSNS